MCGIAGIFHFEEQSRPIDAAVLGAMTKSLAHRGPDGEGLWWAPGIGLGHRRLAILDLSECAGQPMTYRSGELVISYNGEIYNFRELRCTLEGLGHSFRSRSDTEVVLAAYAQWGSDLLEKLSGIFAFAIWNAKRRNLFLARDPMGVKPLFYSVDRGTLRFGSEVKAILCDPAVGREFDEAALDAFFTFSYTPAPSTGFRRVRQLLPGHCAMVDHSGWRDWCYWSVPYARHPRTGNFSSALGDYSQRFDRVTRAQMVSDVPVGAFLSGGLDSAAVVRAMTRADAGAVHALTVGFSESGFDERDGARITAASLGVSLEEQELSLEAASLLPHLSRHMEEPTADSSMLPVFLLCREARRRFTVAMSGDGADELLAGYETYRATAIAARYRKLPGFVRRGIRRAWPVIPITDRKYSLHQVVGRFTYGAELGAGRDHCAWRVIFDDDLKRRLYTAAFGQSVAGCDPLGAYAAHVDAVPQSREPLAGLLNADTRFYLPNDMLVKVDRMSMANGLEVRVPFLDIEMVRFCANLPGEFKLHRHKVRKHILRESLRGSLPDRVLNRSKSGFNIPMERWMRSTLRDLLFDAVATQRHTISEFLRVDEIERVADEHRDRKADHGHALFTVLMFALWLENGAKSWKVGGASHVDNETTMLSCSGG